MFFKRFTTGMYSSNCYIIGDNGESIIIDAGVDAAELAGVISESGLKIKYILLTHAHIDHICCIDDIRKGTGAEVLVHEADARGLTDARYNASALFGLSRTFSEADRTLKDGDIIETGGLKFEIIHTPGHTPGGISIKTGNMIFTGDTLFRMSIGRTDLGNGDYDDIMDSLKNKLMTLPDDVVVYPGHGTYTTIGYEKENNPFIM